MTPQRRELTRLAKALYLLQKRRAKAFEIRALYVSIDRVRAGSIDHVGRPCVCGCGVPSRGASLYAESGCRQRVYDQHRRQRGLRLVKSA